MYAIVEIAGQQFKVEKDQEIYVHQLDAEHGSSLTFDKVFLVQDEANIRVGNPTVDGVAVTAEVIKHVRADKVLVFKKKRRKGYKKLNGHRQSYTKIKISAIA